MYSINFYNITADKTKSIISWSCEELTKEIFYTATIKFIKNFFSKTHKIIQIEIFVATSENLKKYDITPFEEYLIWKYIKDLYEIKTTESDLILAIEYENESKEFFFEFTFIRVYKGVVNSPINLDVSLTKYLTDSNKVFREFAKEGLDATD